jgi:MHS family proline/betaine transporter-like MFS transporter
MNSNPDAAVESRPLSAKRLSAGAVGNVLEWYDFGLYGFMAPIISSLFFPSENRMAALIGTYGVFAIGFLMRPIGGILFGHLGDRAGRQIVLLVSVTIMGVATMLIGCIPDYHSIGIWAPIALISVRLLQGLSVGGEFSGSVTYLVESAPHKKRGLAGSFANVGSIIGTLAGSGAAALTLTLADQATVHEWAWRVPFLIGGLLAVVAYFMRSKLQSDEPDPDDDSQSESDQIPLVEAFTESRRQIILSVLFTSGYGIVFYLSLVYLPTFASEQAGLSQVHALQINSLGLLLALLVVPLAGWISDRFIRRRKLLMISFALTALVGWFAFKAITEGLWGLFAAQATLAVLQGLVLGIAPAMLVELFPGAHRLSGYSVAYNLGLGIAGGTAPLVATALIALTGNELMPAWYLIAASVLAVIATYLMKDRSRQPLR